MQETQVRSLGWEDPLEKRMATHSSILAWRIPWTDGAWRATVHRVTKSPARLIDYTVSSQARQERSRFKKHPPSDFLRNLPFPDEGPRDARLHARSRPEGAIVSARLCPAAPRCFSQMSFCPSMSTRPPPSHQDREPRARGFSTGLVDVWIYVER